MSPIVDPEENRRFFDERAKSWNEENSPGISHAVSAFLGGVREGARVLDVGSGTGNMVPAYLAAKAGCVVCLDVSPNMLAFAREKYGDDARVEFVCHDLLTWEEDASFDCVVMYNVYPHLGNGRVLARKVASLLVPGGRFIVAHGKGRAALNHHHNALEGHIHSLDLDDSELESKPWERYFAIDVRADMPGFYCFGGIKHKE